MLQGYEGAHLYVYMYIYIYNIYIYICAYTGSYMGSLGYRAFKAFWGWVFRGLGLGL